MRTFLDTVRVTPQLVERWMLPPFFLPHCTRDGGASLREIVTDLLGYDEVQHEAHRVGIQTNVWAAFLASFDDEATLLPLQCELQG